MSARELLGRLADDLPGVDPVVPVVLAHGEQLPPVTALVEPMPSSSRTTWRPLVRRARRTER
jgi:hypothetical protein